MVYGVQKMLSQIDLNQLWTPFVILWSDREESGASEHGS
jgi:hypothetical protein